MVESPCGGGGGGLTTSKEEGHCVVTHLLCSEVSLRLWVSRCEENIDKELAVFLWATFLDVTGTGVYNTLGEGLYDAWSHGLGSGLT